MARSRPDRGADPAPADTPARPWWRRGSVWFAVILVEVAAVLAISFAFAPEPDHVSLEGADIGRFCADARSYLADAGQQLPLTIETAAGAFEAQARGYRQLAGSGPTAVRGDFEQLAQLTDELVASARELAARQRADPSANAAALLATRQGELTGRSRRPAERVRAAIRQACGVDIDADPPPVATSPVPSPTAGPPTTATGADAPPGSGGGDTPSGAS